MPIKPNLADPPDPQYTLTFPKYASSKLDGIRGLTQEGTVLSRSLKPIPNLAIIEMLKPFQGLDGELVYGDPADPLCFNKTTSAVMRIKGSAANVTYYVFDVLNMEVPYEERLHDLWRRSFPPFIKVLPQTIIESELELTNYYEHMLELGYEGAILRNPRAIYRQGRSTSKSQNMLKFKPFMDSEAEVLDVLEGEINNNPTFTNELGRTARSKMQEGMESSGIAGKFRVQMGDKIFKIAAGKTSHAERAEIFKNKEKYIGRIATFRHLPIGEKDVPRSGRFIHWRESFDIGVD